MANASASARMELRMNDLGTPAALPVLLST
jgi:hypothetical protein